MTEAMREVNRNPRRWVDESGRVRVIEGRHPSDPGRTGYNVLLDDEWLGSFCTFDGAAQVAAAHIRSRGLHIENGRVVLRPYADPAGRGGTFIGSGLRPVEEPEGDLGPDA
jgi:hypothetical protein